MGSKSLQRLWRSFARQFWDQKGASMIPLLYGGYGLYLLFSLPALLLGLWAQTRVQSAIRKYSQVRAFAGLTGAQVARRVLDMNGLQNVSIEESAAT
jgi:hypothetical protein